MFVASVKHINKNKLAYLVFPTSILIVFHRFFLGFTNMPVPYHIGSIWPWRAEHAVPITRQIIATDQADTYYPWSASISRVLNNHQIPYWNPNSLGGTPAWTNGQPSPFYPPRYLTSFFMDPGLQHDSLILFHFLVAGFGMYFLCKCLKFRTISSLGAGLFWMYSPVVFSRMQYEFFLPTIAYLPWIFLIFKLIANISTNAGRVPDISAYRKTFPLFFFATVLQTLLVLGSNVQYAIIALTPAYIYLIFLTFKNIRNSSSPASVKNEDKVQRKNIAFIVHSFALTIFTASLTILLSASAWLPILLFSNKVSRPGLTYSDFTQSSRTVTTSIFVKNTLFQLPFPYTASHSAQMTFAGTIVGIFALIGFFNFSNKSKHHNIAFARILVSAVLLICIGTPVTWFIYHFVPGMQQLTSLGRLLFLWTFGLCILSAKGIETIIDYFSLRSNSKSKKPSKLLRFLAMTSVIFLIALSVYQTSQYGLNINPPMIARSPENLFPTTPSITALKKIMTTQDRIIPIMRGDVIVAPPIMYMSHQLAYNIDSAAGYESLVLSRNVDTWRVIAGEKPENLAVSRPEASFISDYKLGKVRLSDLPKVGVTIIFGSPDLEQDLNWKNEVTKSGLSFKKIYGGKDAVIFRIAQKSTFLYSSVRCYESDSKGLSDLYSGKAEIVVQEASNKSYCSEVSKKVEDAKIVRKETSDPNSISINVASSKSGLLYIPVTYDDGWTATINGKKAEIVIANHSMMGIPVNFGANNVELEYRTPGINISYFLSIFAISILIIGLADSLRNKRNTTKLESQINFE